MSHALTRHDATDWERHSVRLNELREEGIAWPTPDFANSLKIPFVLIPPGEFMMGCPEVERDFEDEVQPLVPVTLSEGYWLGTYPVTQSQWISVMGTYPWNQSDSYKDGPEYPASHISHSEASRFCEEVTRRGRAEGWLAGNWAVRLPTEAQWEHAARCGTRTPYHFGDDEGQLLDYGWPSENAYSIGEQYPHKVGLKKPNAWGLHDLYGNVWEWCLDWWHHPLPGGTDPVMTDKTHARVYRGGSYSYAGISCTSGWRGFSHQKENSSTGFRVAVVQRRQKKKKK